MIFFRFVTEYPKNEELHQSEKLSIFWQIQIAISLDRKKINASCHFYSIMHSLGLQDIIMDNVVSKNHFLRNVLMRAHCASMTLLKVTLISMFAFMLPCCLTAKG